MIGWLGAAYPWIKAAHVVFVIFWMAGMFMLPRYLVYHQEAGVGTPEAERWIDRERKIRKMIVTPSIIMVWVLGVMLATAILLMGYYKLDAIDVMLAHQYGRVQREDMRVNFYLERGFDALYDMRRLPHVLRPEAMARLAWHRERGDRIVVVSASLDAYLAPWCRAHGLELICSELESREGVLTGNYRGGDCAGAAKAARVRANLRLEDYACVHAYGDTVEDRELLALAHRPVYRWQAAA